MTPLVIPVVQGLQITWFDFTDDADVEKYQVFYGTTSPPTTLWGDVQGKVATILGLTAGVTYFVQIFAVDCFGPGEGSAIVSGVPLALSNDGAGEGSAIVSGVPLALSNDGGGSSGSNPGPILLTGGFQTLASVNVTTSAGAIVFIWASALFNKGPATATTKVTRDGNEIHQGAAVCPSGTLGDTGHLNAFDTPPAGSHTYAFEAKVDGGIPEASRRLIFLLIRQP